MLCISKVIGQSVPLQSQDRMGPTTINVGDVGDIDSQGLPQPLSLRLPSSSSARFHAEDLEEPRSALLSKWVSLRTSTTLLFVAWRVPLPRLKMNSPMTLPPFRRACSPLGPLVTNHPPFFAMRFHSQWNSFSSDRRYRVRTQHSIPQLNL